MPKMKSAQQTLALMMIDFCIFKIQNFDKAADKLEKSINHMISLPKDNIKNVHLMILKLFEMQEKGKIKVDES